MSTYKLYSTLFVVFVVNQICTVSSDNGVQPQFCGAPRPTLVPIDSPNFSYWPYYVKLYRCGGSCSTVTPRLQHCSPSTIDLISHSVFEVATGKMKVVQLANHTGCNCSCTQYPGTCNRQMERWNPKTCSCVCTNPADKPYPCPPRFRWSQYLCKCICDQPPVHCPITKIWNSEACGCICSFDAVKTCSLQNMLLDRDTCRCYNIPPKHAQTADKGIDRNVMIGCMLAELFLLLLLFDVFLNCRHGEGMVTVMQRKCCGKKKNDSIPLDKENTSLNNEVDIDKNNYHNSTC